MSKRKLTKAQSQRVHTKRRAEERYGLSLNRNGQDEIVRKIQYGGAELVERQSNRVTIWKVCFQNTWIKVVYDNSRHTIASVLPMEDRNNNNGNKE